ncbi:MAG: winged helix-turn-helix domain-containing protein [Candidatus Bipolaricaulota bacterium]|nr:winged helix-turn-helix domain-containing protein [Candidatus Bipolaricaulota bacterium]
MNPRAKFVVAVLAFAIALVTALSAFYLTRRSDDLAEQFRERSLWRAQVFAGLAPQHLERGDWHTLFSTIFTAPDVLYAQVVYGGQVRATRSSIPIPPAQLLPQEEGLLPYAPQLLEARTTSGQAYLDVLYPLTVIGEFTDPNSYVRLGLSLAPLEQERRSEVLTIVLIALVALALAGVITWWLAQHLFPEDTLPADVGRQEGPPPRVGEGPGERSLVVDNVAKRVFLNGSEVKLSPKEYELVRLLASEPGRVFSNEEILQAVWAGRQWATAQDVKQYIYFVRKKLEADPENPRFIITVRGFGYKINLD